MWTVSDAQIQLISGHESKKSLEVYQHLVLNTAEHAYQEAVRIDQYLMSAGISFRDALYKNAY